MIAAPGSPRRSGLLAGWCLLLGAALAGLHALGAGPLAAPPAAPGAWAAWVAETGALPASFAGLRLIALALAWYLAAVTAVGSFARLADASRLVAASDLLTVPALRRLLQGALGVGLAAVAVAGSHGVAVVAGDGLREAHAAETEAEDDEGPVEILRALPVDDPGSLPGGDGSADEVGEAEAEDRGAPEVTVRSGDHLWGIASQALAEAWGREPSDREIVPYWRELVALNRERLADPGNPDLVFPGERMLLPELPSP